MNKTEELEEKKLPTTRVDSSTLEPDQKAKFLKSIWENGIYHFDPDQDLARLEQSHQSYRDWHTRVHWESERARKAIADDVDDSKYELAWRSWFSDQIPNDWVRPKGGAGWHTMMRVFEQSRDLAAELPEKLITAGLTYRHHLVVNAVGKSQHLSSEQLLIVFSHPELPKWNVDEIVDAQIEMGTDLSIIEEAKQKAKYKKKSLTQLIKESERKSKIPFLNRIVRYLKGPDE